MRSDGRWTWEGFEGGWGTLDGRRGVAPNQAVADVLRAEYLGGYRPDEMMRGLTVYKDGIMLGMCVVSPSRSASATVSFLSSALTKFLLYLLEQWNREAKTLPLIGAASTVGIVRSLGKCWLIRVHLPDYDTSWDRAHGVRSASQIYVLYLR